MDSLDCAVVANGFSKMMAVTGWRMGFLCAEHEVMDTLIKMQYHVCASPAMPPMYGILAALPHMKPSTYPACTWTPPAVRSTPSPPTRRT